MSSLRFTSPLSHKLPSLLIPTPPESQPDIITASPPNSINPAFSNHEIESRSPESAGTRLRKSSSIPYHSSSLRDNNERGQRTGKPLIIVVPPPTLLYDHVHTLSNGAFHRLSEGVAMPLFPLMTTQLAAIAQEFSFPSTLGLCLYFHHVEDGLTVKPRISDDSWPSIWSYLSDSLSTAERRPLFSGRVEFDIDLRLARWYASWLSSIHRELSDYHVPPFRSTGPLSAHFRRESQDTLHKGRYFDMAEDSLTQPSEPNHHVPRKLSFAEGSFTQPSEPNRHVPRKLSLAERFDLAPVRPDVSRPAFPPPDVQSAGSQFVQEEETKKSRDTLDTRVKSWRERALLIPKPVTATGKATANLPTDTLINNELLLASAKLKMEDFTWSISSAGPKSYDSSSPVSEAHVSSVHLASRLAGSVCLTPSVRGLDSLESISHGSSGTTVWPYIEYSTKSRPPVVASYDIGITNSISAYPYLNIYNPIYPYLEIYPAIPGAMTISSQSSLIPSSNSTLDIQVGFQSPSVYPSFDLYPAVYPFNLEELYPTIMTQSHPVKLSEGYPYFNIYHDLPAPGCPTVQDMMLEAAEIDISQSIHLRKYPTFNLYPAVYPFFDLYPAIEQCKQAHVPAHDFNRELSLSTTVGSVYPIFNIYPPVYPHLEIYPVHQAVAYQPASEQGTETASTFISYDPTFGQDISQSSRNAYPFFNLYPALYPHFDLYPAPSGANVSLQPATPKLLRSSSLFSSTVEPTYPIFNLYPAVYPYFDLYLPLPELEMQPPSRSKKRQGKSRSRLTHSDLQEMVMVEITELARLFDQMEGMKKTEDGHLGLDVHRYTESSSASKILTRPLLDIFGRFLHNMERGTDQRKVENIWEPDSPSKRDSVTWQRTEAIDSSGVLA